MMSHIMAQMSSDLPPKEKLRTVSWHAFRGNQRIHSYHPLVACLQWIALGIKVALLAKLYVIGNDCLSDHLEDVESSPMQPNGSFNR